MKTYYHATQTENLESIIKNGLKRNKIENAVFLCERPEDAAKFLRVRGFTQFVIIPVRVHEKFITESFDHNANFFKCRCWMYHKDVQPRNIDVDNILEYNQNISKGEK